MNTNLLKTGLLAVVVATACSLSANAAMNTSTDIGGIKLGSGSVLTSDVGLIDDIITGGSSGSNTTKVEGIGPVSWTTDGRGRCIVGTNDSTHCAPPAKTGAPTDAEKDACKAALQGLCDAIREARRPGKKKSALNDCSKLEDINYPGLVLECPAGAPQ